MSVMSNVLTRAVAYRQARLAWQAAPKGAEKKAAEEVRDKAHSALLMATELYERQLSRKPP